MQRLIDYIKELFKPKKKRECRCKSSITRDLKLALSQYQGGGNGRRLLNTLIAKYDPKYKGTRPKINPPKRNLSISASSGRGAYAKGKPL